MKVIEKIHAANDEGRVAFSFEYMTAKPGHDAADTLAATVSRMVAHGPAFCDLTWRPNPPYPDLTLEFAARMQRDIGIETMMHLTCIGTPLALIDRALSSARAAGIRNIVALRGDTPKSLDSSANEEGLSSALDLVKHIRATHGDYFGIAVAGYPEAHPSKIPEGSDRATEEGYESDLAYLKSKVDAGADLIITQLFFDTEVFFKFVNDCRRVGIQCPVVPGVLPITTFRNFRFMTVTCRTMVPKEVREEVEARKGDEAALTEYGVELATAMCREMVACGVRALHFYTMNKDAPALAVLRNLGIVGDGDHNAVDNLQNGRRSEAELENELVATA